VQGYIARVVDTSDVTLYVLISYLNQQSIQIE